MGKTYRPYTPTQSQLLPPSPMEWLPKDHLAYFILDVVEQLDLRGIYAHYEREERGYPPHHPKMMVGLLLYGYCVGVPSSRKIERKTHEDVAFRVIAAENHPDHARISEFRRIHLEVLRGLFAQVLGLCLKAGLVKLGHVALDGTKMKANASKHKAMSYERMKKSEKELQEKAAGLLRVAEEEDSREDKLFGKDKRGDELPEELKDPKKRVERIRQLRAELEAEAKQQAEVAEKKDDEPPTGTPSGKATPLPHHEIPRGANGEPTPKAQRNFTDPDSRIMKAGDGFVQGYNCQAAVDEGHQIIVAEAVTNQPPDVEHFVPMMEKVVENCGDVPEKTTADAGYFSEANIVTAACMGIDAFVATGRQKHDAAPPPTWKLPCWGTCAEARIPDSVVGVRDHVCQHQG